MTFQTIEGSFIISLAFDRLTTIIFLQYLSIQRFLESRSTYFLVRPRTLPFKGWTTHSVSFTIDDNIDNRELINPLKVVTGVFIQLYQA